MADATKPRSIDRSYYKSAHWTKFRNWFRELRGNKCEHCGMEPHKTKRGLWPVLIVHHKHYNTVGCETESDVLLLCLKCHEIEHLHMPADTPNYAGYGNVKFKRLEPIGRTVRQRVSRRSGKDTNTSIQL